MPSKRIRENLGYYVLGVAIGLMLVGMLFMLRKRMVPPAPEASSATSTPASQPAH
jgi:hypothetical protein